MEEHPELVERSATIPGREHPGNGGGNGRVHRFSVLERVLHWMLAAAGIVCILTGLGWYTPGFRFLLGWFGGGETARWVHSVAGIVTTIAAVWLIGVIWFHRVFRFIPQDRQWLSVAGGYLRPRPRTHRHDVSNPTSAAPPKPVPPQGFFNAGQKIWGILSVALSIIFLVSGLVIWSPELFADFLGHQPFSVTVMRIMYVAHDAAFILFAPLVLMHTYLGTALDPRSFAGMALGDVSRRWATRHHPLWQQQTGGDEESAG